MADIEFSGMLASAVVKVARDKLVSALRLTMPDDEKLRRHMEELKQTTEDMSEVVGNAERRSTNDEAVREWLIRLEGAAYGIWDMVDELQWKPVCMYVCENTADSRSRPCLAHSENQKVTSNLVAHA